MGESSALRSACSVSSGDGGCARSQCAIAGTTSVNVQPYRSMSGQKDPVSNASRNTMRPCEYAPCAMAARPLMWNIGNGE